MNLRTIFFVGLFLFSSVIHSQSIELVPLANSEAHEFMSNWSSDGQFVYWQRFVSDPITDSQTEFYMTDIANPNSPELILRLDGAIDEVVWSPDGQALAYVEASGIIHILNRDGVEIMSFSEARGDYPLVWSPDSQKLLAYIGDSVSLVQLDGESRVLLEAYAFRYADFEDSYSWSADGETIIIASEGEIYLLRLDGEEAINLTNTQDRVEFSPSLSPDGSKIVFVSLSDGYQYSLNLMNADGTEQQAIVESRFSDFCPEWSPDGSSVVFMRKRSIQADEATLLLYNAESGVVSWLDRPNGETAGCAHWSPNGEWLAFESHRRNWYINNIYIASANAFKTDIAEAQIQYEVAFVPAYLSASIYGDSAGREVIGSLENGSVLSLTGDLQEEWLGIEYEGQAAWIHEHYVLGTIDPTVFCDDVRVLPLIENLKEAVRNRDGEAFARLIAPQGLLVGLQGHSQYLSHEESFGFFNDHRPLFWGMHWNEEPLIYSMADDVLAYLDEDLLGENLSVACQDNQDNLSDNSVLYAVDPSNFRGLVNFYSLMRPGAPGYELDWGAWGIAISYWQDEPRIMALGHYHWTP